MDVLSQGPLLTVASGDESQGTGSGAKESCQKSPPHLEGSYKRWGEVQKIPAIVSNPGLSSKTFRINARSLPL